MKVLVTGAAGFIGSYLTEVLVSQRHSVVAIDNLSTGSLSNLGHLKGDLYIVDVRDFKNYQGIDMVFHLAALGSVPRSLQDPISTHQANVDGFFNTLYYAQQAGVKRFIYASSSSVYGDSDSSLKAERELGYQLSPYSASKRINEIYAEAFMNSYQMNTVGLRFFNVFGLRQNPNGPYSAVIPRWIHLMRNNLDVTIYGDGEQTRDFTYVRNVVQACLGAMRSPSDILKIHPTYNVGTGRSTSLNELFRILSGIIGYKKKPIYLPARAGERKHSRADTTLSQWALDYRPQWSLKDGLEEMIIETGLVA
jgi:UDP-N-acetylglucosamine 4-epimerase